MGLLGSAIAQRLLAAGCRLVAYDADPSRKEQLDLGAEVWAPTPRAVFERSRSVFFSLPTTAESARTVLAVDDLLSPEHLIIDTTTGAPDEVIELAGSLSSRGLRYLDATVSGSSEQARAGEVVILAGGTKRDVEAGRPLLDAFAAHVYHVGPSGSGAKLKLVTNLVLGLHRAVLAEGLVFAEALGIDRFAALHALRASASYSRVMDTKGEKMARRDFTPQARLSQHRKDVRLILEAAARAGKELPFSRLHARLLELVERQGFGDEDNSAILRALERPAGT